MRLRSLYTGEYHDPILVYSDQKWKNRGNDMYFWFWNWFLFEGIHSVPGNEQAALMLAEVKWIE